MAEQRNSNVEESDNEKSTNFSKKEYKQQETEDNTGIQVPKEKDAHLMLGDAYMFTNMIPIAIECYHKALEMQKELEDNEQEIHLYLRLGLAYRLNEQFHTAIEYILKALKIAKSREHKGEEMTYLGLEDAYKIRSNSQLQTSIYYYEKALKFASEREDKRQQTMAYIGLGDVYILNKQIQTAIGYYEEALTITKEQQKKHQETKANFGSGGAHRLDEQFHTEIECYVNSLKIAKKQNDKPQEIIAYLALGDVYNLKDQFQMAIVFYMKALEIAKQREDEPQETEACLGLGHAYRMNNKVEMAIEYFKKGLEIAKKREDKEHKALAYFGLGDGYGMINQFEIAIEYFLKALEIPVTCLDEEDETEIYLSLGYAHKLENQIKTAAEYYQGASEISKEHEKTQKVLQGSEIEETRESDVDDDLKPTPSAMKHSEEAVASLSTITGFSKADAMYAQKRPPKKEPSLVKERGFPKADPMHTQKRPPKKEPSLVGKRGCVTADDMHAQTILPMQGSSLVEKRVDVKKKENNSKDGNTFLEDIFLDSEYSIREEVHEKFKRFSWLSGAYGLKGPNDKIPRPHLYVTVKRGKKKSEVLKEIKEMFECDPKKYFELFREPKRKPKFKYSSKPTSGGGIVAVSKDKDNNPLKVLDQSVDEGSRVLRASGTLTMFCSQNDNHYALTCFHVGCATDEQCFHQTFKHQELVDIQKSMEGYKRYAREQQEYYYKDQDNESTDENYNPITPANYIHLGKFSKCCFHSESDIMSIQVREDIEIHCRVAEIDFPDWKKIWKELYDRVVCNGRSEDHVTVQKHGYTTNLKHTGRIVECNFSYKCQDRVLFQNAIVVKGNSQTFLKDGDSGALICFLDNSNEKQAFAYGVCEVDQLQPEEMSSDEDCDNSSQPSTSSEDSSEKEFTFLDDEGTSSEGCGAGATRCVRKDEDEDNSDEEVISAKTSDEVSGAAAMVGESKDENEECSDDDFIIFQDEGPFAICLKLNTALENLGLSNAGCFKECGGRK